jgi:hypothetical protein
VLADVAEARSGAVPDPHGDRARPARSRRQRQPDGSRLQRRWTCVAAP